KLAALDGDDELVAATVVDPWDGEGDVERLGEFVEDAGSVDAVGHRVVHGGTEFRAPVVLDDDVVARLTALTSLAPLHQPRALEAVRAVGTLLPDHPAVACFDTAFHATIPPEA